MSAANSPTHRINGFDGTAYYDPDFTVEISNKMRVPDKISLMNDGDGSGSDRDSRDRYTSNRHDPNDWMHVPDRILVAGGDKYAAGRAPLPEMKLESSMLGEDVHTDQMMTPPRHLTLNDHKYPSVEPENDLNSLESEKSYNKNRTKEINFSPVQETSNYG